MPIHDDKTCETCRYWQKEHSTDEGAVEEGECRRRAPMVVLEQLPVTHRRECSIRGEVSQEDMIEYARRAMWPLTLAYFWCGEYADDLDHKETT